MSPTTPLSELVTRIRKLIAKGDLTEALDILRNLALNGPSELADEAIVLSSRHVRLSRDMRKGVITAEQANVESNRVEGAALGLLTDLEKKLSNSAAPVPAPLAAADSFAGAEVMNGEKIIGVNNLKQIAWIEQGLRMSRAVCRVLTPEGLGTGFLIRSRVIMTNNHVIPSLAVARKTKVEFNYQLQFGSGEKPVTSVRYDLDPDQFFRTSPINALDYSVVAVKPHSATDGPVVDSWGTLNLNPYADPVAKELVVIVQHPNGGTKQIALTANAVLQVAPPFLHYSTDTMPGSSGSPIFNDLWQVIAIHHAAGPLIKMPNNETRYSNEGAGQLHVKALKNKPKPFRAIRYPSRIVYVCQRSNLCGKCLAAISLAPDGEIRKKFLVQCRCEFGWSLH